ncbi:MAG: hypothetical protein PHS93_09045 [Candidatus Omnitrophica bacterium]|nr:hypothetical protein [Candidatus Omnitrophota bacterium]
MTLQEAKSLYLNSNPRERTLGRYYSSELYSIIGNWKKPEDFFNPDPIKEEHLDIVLRGMMAEYQLAEILKPMGVKCGDNQSKYELKINDEIVVVVKPDFEWPSVIWETKYPREMIYSVPRKYRYQLECQYRATNKKVKLGVFSEPFNLMLINYESSDRVWEEIQRSLINYHKKVKELCQTIRT